MWRSGFLRPLWGGQLCDNIWRSILKLLVSCLDRIKMGCAFSSEALQDGSVTGKPLQLLGEVFVFVPGLRVPKQVEISEVLQRSVSAELASRLQSLRSEVIAASGRNLPGSKLRRKKQQSEVLSAFDLEKTLHSYLPVLLGLVNGGEKLCTSVTFEWINVEEEKKETGLATAQYELLSVLQLLGMLALEEANSLLTPRPPAEGYSPKVTEESKRNAIETLLKASSYFECAISGVLPNVPEEISVKLPADVTEAMFRTMEQQALGQAVELQLGFAIDNVKASLAVKRRLACEQVKVWAQANEKIAFVPFSEAWREKHLLFVQWKLCEAKAAAYYFHGLILDEGYEDNAHALSLASVKAAENYLKESQKARTNFGSMEPLTKIPPLWGPMKYLTEKIPREVLHKSRIFRENYRNEKLPTAVPELPDFPIALTADQFVLPPVDAAWEHEPAYETKNLKTTSDVPAFLLAKHEPNQKQNSVGKLDLRRARPMSPPLKPMVEMLQAR